MGCVSNTFRIGGVFEIVCRDKHGREKWRERMHNLYTTEGINHILDVVFKGTSSDATLYVGLYKTEAIVAGDTMAGNGTNWYESTDYDETARQEWVDGSISGGQLDNSGSPAVFTMNATVTILGAFITNDSTKGGTSGVLFCGEAFSQGSRSVVDDDTITVTYTVGAQDDGA